MGYKCPRCGNHILMRTDRAYATDPLQYEFRCDNIACGWKWDGSLSSFYAQFEPCGDGNDQTAKADAGKPILTWVPMQIVWDIADVRRYGNEKYGSPDNWKTVEPERHFEAFLRHVVKAWDGDHMTVYPESGLLHLAHAACDLAFFLALMEGKE